METMTNRSVDELVFVFQNGDSVNSGSSRELFSVQKLAEKFASVAFKSGKDCVENNAFEAIGDDEL